MLLLVVLGELLMLLGLWLLLHVLLLLRRHLHALVLWGCALVLLGLVLLLHLWLWLLLREALRHVLTPLVCCAPLLRRNLWLTLLLVLLRLALLLHVLLLMLLLRGHKHLLLLGRHVLLWWGVELLWRDGVRLRSHCVLRLHGRVLRRDLVGLLGASKTAHIRTTAAEDFDVAVTHRRAIVLHGDVAVVLGHDLDESLTGGALLRVVDQVDALGNNVHIMEELGDLRFSGVEGKASNTDDPLAWLARGRLVWTDAGHRGTTATATHGRVESTTATTTGHAAGRGDEDITLVGIADENLDVARAHHGAVLLQGSLQSFLGGELDKGVTGGAAVKAGANLDVGDAGSDVTEELVDVDFVSLERKTTEADDEVLLVTHGLELLSSELHGTLCRWVELDVAGSNALTVQLGMGVGALLNALELDESFAAMVPLGDNDDRVLVGKFVALIEGANVVLGGGVRKTAHAEDVTVGRERISGELVHSQLGRWLRLLLLHWLEALSLLLLLFSTLLKLLLLWLRLLRWLDLRGRLVSLRLRLLLRLLLLLFRHA